MNALRPVLFSLLVSASLVSAEWLPLWPGQAPGGTKPVTLTESTGKGGRLTDITVPQYEVHLPEPSKTHGSGGDHPARRRLPGENPDSQLAARVSTEKRVNAKTPPCFLVHAADDGTVPVRNSLEFAARCAENKVPVVCHVFANGGHGFSLRGKGDSVEWPALLAGQAYRSSSANGRRWMAKVITP